MGKKDKLVKIEKNRIKYLAEIIGEQFEPKANEILNCDLVKTEKDFYLGKMANYFNKLCKKNNLSTKNEFLKRVPPWDFSKFKALGIMAIRADINKHPELLWLGSHRLIKLAAYTKKGKKVSHLLIENGIAFEGDMIDRISVMQFIFDVDEHLLHVKSMNYSKHLEWLEERRMAGLIFDSI